MFYFFKMEDLLFKPEIKTYTLHSTRKNGNIYISKIKREKKLPKIQQYFNSNQIKYNEFLNNKDKYNSIQNKSYYLQSLTNLSFSSCRKYIIDNNL